MGRIHARSRLFRHQPNPGGDISNARIAPASDYTKTAEEFVKSVVGKATFRLVSDHYVGTNGVAHVRFKQTVNDIDVDNADFNVNVSYLTRFA